MVSVVIPLYNKERTIRRALDSVIRQTCAPDEIIVVDDGSTDRSVDVVRSCYDGRVRVIPQRNAGPGAARNAGIRAARHARIALLDADDEWLPDFLARGMAALDARRDCRFFFCRYRVEPTSMASRYGVRFDRLRPGPHAASDYDDARQVVDLIHAVHSSCLLADRDFVLQLGGYFDREPCMFGEDSFLMFRMVFAGPHVFDDKASVLFHLDHSSLGFAVKYQREATPISRFAEELVSACPSQARPLAERVVRLWAEHDVRRLAAAGQFDKAAALRRSLDILPRLWPLRDRAKYVTHRLSVLRHTLSAVHRPHG